MNQWHIIKTKPLKENDVCNLLTKAHFEVFSPKIKEVFYRQRQENFKIKSLFPSYLFLNIDFDKAENIHLIKYTRGVSKILCAEKKPLPLPDQIIKTLKGRTNEDGVIEHHTALKAGDYIRVKKGLLRDLEGILVRPASEEERLIVLLKHVSFKMSAKLHWTEIEKL